MKPRQQSVPVVCAAVGLLERHHSCPFYGRLRRMTWWHKEKLWKGTWPVKGQGKGAGKTKNQGKQPKKETVASKETSYDSDQWLVGDALSSSSASSSAKGSQEEKSEILMKTVKALMESSQNVPEEAKRLLTGLEDSEKKQELFQDIKKDQSMLNKRRKAFVKLTRLKEALEKKHVRFKAYKTTMREQLQRETKKYEEDVQELQESIAMAETHLDQIEKGLDMEEGRLNQEVEETDLMQLVKDSDDEKNDKEQKKRLRDAQEQLRQSQTEGLQLKGMVQNYAAQMETMQNHILQLTTQIHGGTPPNAAMVNPKGFGSTAGSPQIPNTGRIRDPMAPFGVAAKTKVRDGPYSDSQESAAAKELKDGKGVTTTPTDVKENEMD